MSSFQAASTLLSFIMTFTREFRVVYLARARVCSMGVRPCVLLKHLNVINAFMRPALAF